MSHDAPHPMDGGDKGGLNFGGNPALDFSSIMSGQGGKGGSLFGDASGSISKLFGDPSGLLKQLQQAQGSGGGGGGSTG
jgi:hypothetical protein